MKECAASHLSPCIAPAQLRCGSCGAVCYCSRVHQRLHWIQHKEECERMAQQMQRGAVLHVFPFSFAPETTLLVDKGVSTLCSFFEKRGIHKMGFWRVECECGHAELSPLGKSGRDSNWHLPPNMCPCTDAVSQLTGSLETWADYYNWRQLSFDSPVAIVLHWPLTLYHVLKLTTVQGRTSFPRPGDFLQVHYLGPERELDQLEVFQELHALLPMVRIHIDFVGPSIPNSRDGEVLELTDYIKCSDAHCVCKLHETRHHVKKDETVCAIDRKQRSNKVPITLKLWKGFYHDLYEELIQGSSPDLIFGPNAGLAAFPSWLPTVKLISSTQVPAIFTDFCEEAAILAAQCVSEALAMAVTYPVQVNPFRQPTIPPNKITELPSYSNCFILGIN